MPLTLADLGVTYSIRRVRGGDGLHQHLENMGILPGSEISVIATTIGGNIIVSVKGSRLAISTDVAQHILV